MGPGATSSSVSGICSRTGCGLSALGFGETRSLKPQSVTVSGDLVRVQINNAPFSSVIEWAYEIQKTARLSVIDSNFVAQTQTDIVNATLNLRQPKTDENP